jgi:integrase/recombinase XerC
VTTELGHPAGPSLPDQALPAAAATARAGYASWLTGTGLAARTKQTYLQRLDAFLAWLAAHGDEQHVAAFVEAHARDYAVRDYKRHLLATGASMATVKLALVSLESFYTWLGLGPPNIARLTGARRRTAPRALTVEQQRRLLRAAERRGPRDHALIALALDTGLRIAELAALDDADVPITPRTGKAIVRLGKGDRPREIPLPARTRTLISDWRTHRREKQLGTSEPALLVTRSGHRLSARSIDHIIRTAGNEVDLTISPHTLRHTFATGLVRAGYDLVLVASLLGHARTDTVRIYTLPSETDVATAVETITVDY